MTTNQAEAARSRWNATPPEERTEATRPAVTASAHRRKLAHQVLAALEAAGLVVEPADTKVHK